MFKKLRKHRIGFRDCMSHDQTSWNLQPIKRPAPLGWIFLKIIIWAGLAFLLYKIFSP